VADSSQNPRRYIRPRSPSASKSPPHGRRDGLPDVIAATSPALIPGATIRVKKKPPLEPERGGSAQYYMKHELWSGRISRRVKGSPCRETRRADRGTRAGSSARIRETR